ncbi:cation:proton antiporter [Pseudoclavibacter sp. CFCC 14310]|nr:cation:proton antiporter [Pseudoclavibacter sp. CFCC 14310]KAB1663120.1 cation:proton antiporter [Pseudoclavibacter sp. CFCC 13611]
MLTQAASPAVHRLRVVQHLTLSIALLPILAVVATLITRFIGRIAPVPLPAIEIVLGVIAGPAVLGLIQPNEMISVLSELGGAFLFLLAGTEIDVRAITGRPLRRAAGAWVISFAVLFALGSVAAGAAVAPVIAIALSSTAVGMLLPILKDAGDLGSPFATSVVANGAVGEFLPLIMMSLLLSGRTLSTSLLVLVIFAVIAVFLLWLANRIPHARLHRFIRETQHTSSQFALRLVIMIMGVLIALDLLLGIDTLLGAFTAGMVLRVLLSDAPHEDAAFVESKLQGIGFGLLVPIFFINAGLGFDLQALFASPILLLITVGSALALFVVRGLPGMLTAARGSSARSRFALAAYTGTALPIIVAASTLAVSQQIIGSGLAAALIGGGLLSVIIGPVVGATLHKPQGQTGAGGQRGDAASASRDEDPGDTPFVTTLG